MNKIMKKAMVRHTPTSEMLEILNLDLRVVKIIAIEALAGSGKTTTLIEMALRNPLITFAYVSFNEANAAAVKKEMAAAGVTNVIVSTVHALALRATKESRKKGRIMDLDPDLISKTLSLPMKTMSNYRELYFVKRLFSGFCSQRKNFEEYRAEVLLDSGDDIKLVARALVSVKKLFDGMQKSEFGFITHDFYLKDYIDGNYQIEADFLMIDEAQDLSLIMFALAEKQILAGKGVIGVGDQNQSIYGFLNSLDILSWLVKEWGGVKKTLSRSFRFSAGSDMEILANLFLSPRGTRIYGTAVHADNQLRNTGYLGRTNMQVIRKCIDLIIQRRGFALAGGIKSLGLGLIYDVWNLSSRQSKHNIRSEFVKGFSSKMDLKMWALDHDAMEYISAINAVDEIKQWEKDPAIRAAIQHNKESSFLKSLIDSIEKHDTKRSDIVVSTFHKSKGLGIDLIEILSSHRGSAPVVPAGWKIDKRFEIEGLSDDPDAPSFPTVMINFIPDNFIFDEYNLMYVAVTRAKKRLLVHDQKLIASANFLFDIQKAIKKKQKITLPEFEGEFYEFGIYINPICSIRYILPCPDAELFLSAVNKRG